MQVNAEFVGAVYDSANAHDVYRAHLIVKTIAIILDTRLPLPDGGPDPDESGLRAVTLGSVLAPV
ncbi:hypothetical protein PF005_g9900 [Phytophthora fragariae]|nr:hypothetical protein PF003_g3215 [Phytophthora fragariae]KAE8939167.1 hypothetical protein PF009_g10986 [Phytophthora fragariae]KAE9122606.1 hypothetical protein PF007_g7392 [Phytophthora fragariae]KAE9124000.1 hypothetical protein PF010_g6178 [Phytophthora fragariae]KAE9149240.1 hypothetical protein PF006_g6249 [Phytophthora fragariae]